MNWDNLKIFYHVAKVESITQAANALNITQPAVSRTIKNLEYRLKMKLFYRRSRGVQLTKEGEVMFEAASKMHHVLSQAQQRVDEDHKDLKGQFNIGSTAGFAELYLTPCIPGFLEKHPDVALDINANDILPDVASREVDVLIAPYIPDQPKLIQELLAVFSLKLYASPDYLKKFGTPKTAEDLDAHRLIGFGNHKINPFLPLNWHLSEGMPEGEVRKPYLQINLAPSRCKFAESNLGIITVPSQTPGLSSMNLVEVLPDVTGPVIEMYYIYTEHIKDFKKVKTFGDYIKGAFETYR